VKFPDAVRRLIGIPEDEAIVMGIVPGCTGDRNNNWFRTEVSLWRTC
jgi:hypothetical protein